MLQNSFLYLQKGASRFTKRSRGHKKEHGAPFCNIKGNIKDHARLQKGSLICKPTNQPNSIRDWIRFVSRDRGLNTGRD